MLEILNENQMLNIKEIDYARAYKLFSTLASSSESKHLFALNKGKCNLKKNREKKLSSLFIFITCYTM